MNNAITQPKRRTLRLNFEKVLSLKWVKETASFFRFLSKSISDVSADSYEVISEALEDISLGLSEGENLTADFTPPTEWKSPVPATKTRRSRAPAITANTSRAENTSLSS